MNLNKPKVTAQPEAPTIRESLAPINQAVSVVIDEAEGRCIETKAVLFVYNHDAPEHSRLLIKWEGGRGVFVPLQAVTFI